MAGNAYLWVQTFMWARHAAPQMHACKASQASKEVPGNGIPAANAVTSNADVYLTGKGCRQSGLTSRHALLCIDKYLYTKKLL